MNLHKRKYLSENSHFVSKASALKKNKKTNATLGCASSTTPYKDLQGRGCYDEVTPRQRVGVPMATEL